MKKKSVLLLISFLKLFCLFSQDFNFCPKFCDAVKFYPEKTYEIPIYIRNNGRIYNIMKSEHGHPRVEETFPYVIENEGGFTYCLMQHPVKKDKYLKQYFLEGKNILVFFMFLQFDKLKLSDIEMKWKKDWPDDKKYGMFDESLGKRKQVAFFLEDGIKNISASSYLKEAKIEYKPEGLRERIYLNIFMERYFTYDDLSDPWVEGVEGPGIGEYLECEFKFKTDEIQILNGFVDFRRPALFKQNNRVKTVLIESENPKFAKEYTLEDIVKYNVIKLPARTDKIKITIKDVYKGTLYDDTCLSSIIADDPDYDMEADFAELKKWINDDRLFETK